MRSLYDMLDGQSDHDMRYWQDWFDHYQPTRPEWHRGIVWSDEMQAKWVMAWNAGDTSLQVAVGRRQRHAETCVFLDGLNSFNAVRRAITGELTLSGGPLDVKALSFRVNTMRVKVYCGTPEELRRCTYLLNRGSPMAWTTEQLPR